MGVTRNILPMGAALCGLISSLEADTRPNIVIIVADDLGYADLGSYGNTTAQTPNLDRMAAEGIRFTDFYANSPMCSPTRAALLTGRYQQRTGVVRVGEVMHQTEITLGERLRDAGYATAYFGKWHISGHYHNPEMRRERMPMDFGFDLFRGFMGGFIDFQNYLDDRGNLDWWHNRELVKDDEGYATHILSDHLDQFIRDQAGQRPFLAIFALPDIHFPWMTPDDPPHYRPGERATNFDPELDRLGPHTGTDYLQTAVHRMIKEADLASGRVMDTLEALGIADNTWVFFVSDNGGYIHYRDRFHGQISSNGPLRGQKGQLYEGGIRVPALAWQPGALPAGLVIDEPAMTADLVPTVLAMAGLPAPDADDPNRLDGIDLAPIWQAGGRLPERRLYFAFQRARAVRDGPWKLLQPGDDAPELYRLDKDIGESEDLAADYPDRSAALLAALQEWYADVSGIPSAFRRLKPGKELFSNRNYTIHSVPEGWENYRFLKSPLERTQWTAPAACTIYVLSQPAGRRGSLADKLLEKGFRITDHPPFVFWIAHEDPKECLVFERTVESGASWSDPNSRNL